MLRRNHKGVPGKPGPSSQTKDVLQGGGGGHPGQMTGQECKDWELTKKFSKIEDAGNLYKSSLSRLMGTTFD